MNAVFQPSTPCKQTGHRRASGGASATRPAHIRHSDVWPQGCSTVPRAPSRQTTHRCTVSSCSLSSAVYRTQHGPAATTRVCSPKQGYSCLHGSPEDSFLTLHGFRGHVSNGRCSDCCSSSGDGGWSACFPVQTDLRPLALAHLDLAYSHTYSSKDVELVQDNGEMR